MPLQYSLLIILFSIAFAYMIALFSKSILYDKIQTILKINRTSNSNIWYDVFKKDMWVRVFLKDGITTYLGQIEMLEENSKEPIIVLSRYQLVNLNGDVIIDYLNKPEEKIMINLREFEKIELTDIISN